MSLQGEVRNQRDSNQTRPMIRKSGGTFFFQIWCQVQAEAALISFERRDIFLAAVFLWSTPFLAALSMTDFAAFSFSCETTPSLSLTACRTSLTIPLILVLTDLFRIRLISF